MDETTIEVTFKGRKLFEDQRQNAQQKKKHSTIFEIVRWFFSGLWIPFRHMPGLNSSPKTKRINTDPSKQVLKYLGLRKL